MRSTSLEASKTRELWHVELHDSRDARTFNIGLSCPGGASSPFSAAGQSSSVYSPFVSTEATPWTRIRMDALVNIRSTLKCTKNI
jgi:hypothetical protein